MPCMWIISREDTWSINIMHPHQFDFSFSIKKTYYDFLITNSRNLYRGKYLDLCDYLTEN